LQILPRGEHSTSDRLVWHVTSLAEGERGPEQWEHFVDAQTGDIAWSFERLETSASLGAGKTMWSGTQVLNTDFTGRTYALRDLTRGGGNYTCKMFDGYFGCNLVSSTSNVFGNGDRDNTDTQTAAADAHFGIQATWSYFKNTFNRNGTDNAGTTVYARVHYGFSYENAYWNDACSCITFGDGASNFYPLTSLDITAHEFAHGVMASEAALTFSGESGGLNESSSDIFGALVELSVNSANDTPDWWIGERPLRSNWPSGSFQQTAAIRYMDDPHKDGTSPACWSSTLGSLDVHYSSGPNNHMFYLLANGGVSKCNGQTVIGIGSSKAARIWYKAITDYMTSSTNYHGARVAALSAATALYGAYSAEYFAVSAAYAAIDVQ
jgi:Zn-dependent metalloprotease